MVPGSTVSDRYYTYADDMTIAMVCSSSEIYTNILDAVKT